MGSRIAGWSTLSWFKKPEVELREALSELRASGMVPDS